MTRTAIAQVIAAILVLAGLWWTVDAGPDGTAVADAATGVSLVVLAVARRCVRGTGVPRCSRRSRRSCGSPALRCRRAQFLHRGALAWLVLAYPGAAPAAAVGDRGGRARVGRQPGARTRGRARRHGDARDRGGRGSRRATAANPTHRARAGRRRARGRARPRGVLDAAGLPGRVTMRPPRSRCPCTSSAPRTSRCCC